MGDKALDDFFAKKDKKKKVKSKAKFTTTDGIAKKLSEGPSTTTTTSTKKKKDREKESRSSATVTTSTTDSLNPTDESDSGKLKENVESEWKEFDSPDEKDYSGLKVQSMQIGSAADTDDNEPEEDEYDEEGELIIKPKDTATGPWKAMESTKPDIVTQPVPAVPVIDTSKSVQGGVYRPPGARMAKTTTTMTRRGGKQKAPDVSSEQQFPTLAASLEKPPAGSDIYDKHFEKVTRGGRVSADDGNRGPRLDLENKYAALSKN